MEEEHITEEEELPVLEEQVEPLPEESEALPEEHILTDSEGRKYRITKLVSPGDLREYTGEALVGDQVSERVIIMQAVTQEAQAQLDRIQFMLQSVMSPMLPAVKTNIKEEKSAYLILEKPDASTLSDALASNLPFPRLINILAQVASGVQRMHEAGWLHLGLRPEEIYLTKPIKIMGLEYICRIGEKPQGAFYIPGYSAPELIQQELPDARTDVYSIGAILYRAVTGNPIAETGADLMTWQPPKPMPGVPQILSSCLGDRESRYPNMASLHASLLSLTRRLLPRISFDIAASTTIGLEPTRSTNQDAYGYVSGGMGSDEGEEAWSVTCVSDGMGGMAAGEVASHAAVQTILRLAMDRLKDGRQLSVDEQVSVVKDWMEAANDKVIAAMEARRVRGGCTMVITLLINRRLTIAHVGDCRIYLIRGDEVKQLTHDHSLAVALAVQGQIEMSEVRHHPDRNMVTRSLGERHPLPEYFIDTLEQTAGKTTMELQAGDILLLCSDGLWEPVVESEMLEAVRRYAPDLSASADAMVTLALKRGAEDNATVLLLRMDEKSALSEEEEV